MLAAVAVGAGADTSGTCSRLSSVNSSFDGVICSSGSGAAISSIEGVSTASIGAGSGTDGSGSGIWASTGSSTLTGSAGLDNWSAEALHIAFVTYFSITGSGAFFGTGAGAKILAQLFLTPSGMTLEVALAAIDAEAPTAPAAAAVHDSSVVGFPVSQLPSVGFGVSQDDSAAGALPHAFDSAVGVDVSTTFSLRTPFVGARPRPPRTPLSVARPRPPLVPSFAARPPRETLEWLVTSPKDVMVAASLTLDLDRSFLVFETSPH